MRFKFDRCVTIRKTWFRYIILNKTKKDFHESENLFFIMRLGRVK